MSANRLGIDFSQDYFDLVLADATGRLISPVKRYTHDRPGSQQACDYVLSLCQQHPADQLWIGGESTGLLWWHLFQSWATDPQLAELSPAFFLLNPQAVKQFRKATAHTDKTDPQDARLIVRYLGLPDHQLPLWFPDAASWPLRFLTRYRCRLSHQLASLKLQALSILYIKSSAFHLCQPFNDPFGAASQKILARYPTLDGLAQAPLEDLAQQLDEWGRQKFADPLQTAHQLHATAQRSYPISDPLAQTVQFILDGLLKLIQTYQAQIKRCDHYLAEYFSDDLDLAHLDAIPGIGPATAAGLAAEMRPTQRFFLADKFDLQHGVYRPRTLRDAQAAVAKIAGLWWPRKQSGQYDSPERHLPRACNPYLRYYLVEAAQHVREHVAEYGQFYQEKYREVPKHQHRRALLLTARKLARLVFALLHRHEAYQPRRCASA